MLNYEEQRRSVPSRVRSRRGGSCNFDSREREKERKRIIASDELSRKRRARTDTDDSAGGDGFSARKLNNARVTSSRVHMPDFAHDESHPGYIRGRGSKPKTFRADIAPPTDFIYTFVGLTRRIARINRRRYGCNTSKRRNAQCLSAAPIMEIVPLSRDNKLTDARANLCRNNNRIIALNQE